jgi:tetratricopeptide (TPR) repeat protein
MRAWHADNPPSVLIWLGLAVLIAYANVLSGSFQFDDYNVIVNEPSVHGWSNWFAGLDHGIRPLLKFSYTLNWTMGTGVMGFHLTNLLIHLANAYLVCLLSQSFIRQQWQHARLQHVPLIAALLFALHPVHTEAVSYISGRSASLMTLFYLAGVLSYINGRQQDDWKLLYLATPLSFLLALATKETAVTFPLALLAWELCCGGRWKTRLNQMWPSWAVLGVAAAFFLLSDSYASQMQRSAEFNSLQGNLATQLAACVWLMKQWLLPLWLNIDPDLPLLTDVSAALLPLAFFVVAVAVMLLSRRRRPWISFALAWAMLQLIPLYLFLPRLDIANERQLYLAGWPLFLALSMETTLRLNAATFRLAVAASLLAFASLTILRNQVYASEISLWQDTAMKSPHKARVHNNLGHAYLLAQRHAEARREFGTALQLNPRHYRALHNLYRLDGQIDPPGETGSER